MTIPTSTPIRPDLPVALALACRAVVTRRARAEAGQRRRRVLARRAVVTCRAEVDRRQRRRRVLARHAVACRARTESRRRPQVVPECRTVAPSEGGSSIFWRSGSWRASASLDAHWDY